MIWLLLAAAEPLTVGQQRAVEKYHFYCELPHTAEFWETYSETIETICDEDMNEDGGDILEWMRSYEEHDAKESGKPMITREEWLRSRGERG